MKKIFLGGLILVSMLIAACGGTATEPVVVDAIPAEYAGLSNPLGSDAAEAGAEIFQNNCSSCHGAQGHGDGPAGASLNPRPKNLPDLAATVGDDYLYWRIETGKPGTPMIGWKGILTEEQIWQIVSFIRTLK